MCGIGASSANVATPWTLLPRAFAARAVDIHVYQGDVLVLWGVNYDQGTPEPLRESLRAGLEVADNSRIAIDPQDPRHASLKENLRIEVEYLGAVKTDQLRLTRNRHPIGSGSWRRAGVVCVGPPPGITTRTLARRASPGPSGTAGRAALRGVAQIVVAAPVQSQAVLVADHRRRLGDGAALECRNASAPHAGTLVKFSPRVCRFLICRCRSKLLFLPATKRQCSGLAP